MPQYEHDTFPDRYDRSLVEEAHIFDDMLDISHNDIYGAKTK